MSSNDKTYPPRPDEDHDVGIPPRWLIERNAIPTNASGNQFRDNLPFVDSLGAGPRHRRALTLELQEETDSPEAFPPPVPPDDSTRIPSTWRRAGDNLADEDPLLNAAGSSVAPVAMESVEQPAPRFARRQVVHSAAYAVLLGALCIGAVGFYRGGGFERATWTADPAKARATSPVQRVLAAAPIQILSAVVAPAKEIEAAPFDLARVDAALDVAWGRAKACTPPQDRGLPVSMNVVIAPTGRITSAWVASESYGGTTIGHCIARKFRSTVTAPFQGEALVIHRVYLVQ
jgi:hypothetical protein